MIKRAFILILVVSVPFLFCSKKDKGESEGKPAASVSELNQKPLKLNKEIVGQPPSIISITSPIDLTFREPVIPSHLSGTRLDKNPFRFSPKISGKAEWLSQTMLRFTPYQRLPAGTEFKGTLNGKQAFGSLRNVDDFEFTFKTAEQEVINLLGDFFPASSGKNMVFYRGILTFAQAVDIKVIEKDLQCKESRGSVTLTLSPDTAGQNRIIVVTESLKRGDKGRTLTFSLPKKYTVAGEKWQQDVLLPAANQFSVVFHMDMSDPDGRQQTYGFRFSDPIKENIDLSGYVSVEPGVAYDVIIDDKYLKLTGDFIPGNSYRITIREGFPSALQTKLASNYIESFSFTNIKPAVEWLSDGIFLPSSNKFKLQFKTVNIGRLELKVYEVFPQNIGFFLQSNRLHGTEDKRYWSDMNRVAESIFDSSVTITSERNQWIKSELNLSKLFSGKRNTAFIIYASFTSDMLVGPCVDDRNELKAGDLYYEDDDYYSNPCNGGYYYEKGQISKLLIASDIGFTVKRYNDTLQVHAIDIVVARPASGLELGLYSYVNKLLEKKTTDRNGKVTFTESGGSYIRGLGEANSALFSLNHPNWDVSGFDVGGVDRSRDGVSAFMYTDRGVHRPGDTVHLAAIIRTNREAPPKNLPVLLEVKNPKGQVVLETKQSAGKNGHVYFPVATDLSDPTGSWYAKLTVGSASFTKTLKIETVKPNRLKVRIDVSDTVYSKDDVISGTVSSKYLFGTPSANLKTRLSIEMANRSLFIPTLRDYTFRHPLKKFESEEQFITVDSLDEDGTLEFEYGIDKEKELAPELIGGYITAMVYEKGGSFTKQVHRTTIVPYSAYVGIKGNFRWGNARVGETYTLPIVTVNTQGKPVGGHRLTVKHYLNRNHWWWEYDNNNRNDFRMMKTTYEINKEMYVSGDDPINYQLEVEDQGQHLIEVIDETSGHSTGLFFWGSRWGQSARSPKEGPQHLELSSDKNMYAVGEQATIGFDAPGDGVALFSLEQGSRIISQDVQQVKKGYVKFTFPVDADLVPNCYVVVSYVQRHGNAENDLPLRTFGVKTLHIEDPTTRVPISLDAPEEIRPNSTFSLSLTSQAKKNVTYTVAVVDEGLLDLTGFATPDPWQFFFEKIRLGILTMDNYNEILGILMPDMDKQFSIGGASAQEQKKRIDDTKVKRFEPVVLFKGPLTIEPGATGKVTFDMPNYVGSVRVMVVACAGHSYSSVDATVPVRKPLMLLTTVPRVARPGDEFAVPVSVFSMDKSVGATSISLTTSKELRIIGDAKLSVSFEKPGEKDVAFRVAVGERIGAGTVTVRAVSGKHSSYDSVALPITAPNPFYTRVTDTVVQKGTEVTFAPEKIGIEGTNGAELNIYRIPDIQVSKRLTYLIRYPYGCIEQTVSSAFPQLYISHLVDLTSIQKKEITDNINAAIERLNRFSLSSGGFGFWPIGNYGSPSYSDWGTSYAGHFLIEARKIGYHVPTSVYDHWLRSAKKNARKINRENHRYQAYRLFTLALAGEADQGAMNLMRENYLSELDPLSKKLLAAAFFLAGQSDAAKRIDKSSMTEITSYREMGGTFGSSLRDRAMITYLTVVMEDMGQAAKLFRSLAKEFRPSGWYSTQETAMALLAVSTLAKKQPNSGSSIPVWVAIEGEKKQKIMLDRYSETIDLTGKWGKTVRISTESSNPLFINLFEEGIPLEDIIETASSGVELTRNFYDENGRMITQNDIRQGNPFWVRYRVRSLTSERLEELALSSLFPSGWEIMNPRLENNNQPQWVSNINATQGTYMDIRDDRVNWFFDLYGAEKNFVIKINPTFKGDFRYPPVSVEAMYSPDYYARIEGGRAVVE